MVFSLDLRRAATMGNQLVPHLSLDGVEQNGGNRYLKNEVSTSFMVPSADHPWSDYQIIMWQAQTPAGYAALKEASGSLPEWCKRTTAMKRAPPCPALPVWSTPICAAISKTSRPISILLITSGTMIARQTGDFSKPNSAIGQIPVIAPAFIREPGLSNPEWLE